MYVSRLTFATVPGRTHEAEEKLKQLRDLVAKAGGRRPRVLRAHFASLGAPDLVFEEEAPDLATLEREIGAVTGDDEFQRLSREVSGLLVHSSKREIYQVID
jgi:hypothetical protein